MTSTSTLFALCAAVLIGIGVYGLIVQPHPLRKIISFNVIGSGVFVLFGAVAKRGAAASFGGDPVPQALLITGIVVAFSATALAVALVVRLIEASGSASLANDVADVGQGGVRVDHKGNSNAEGKADRQSEGPVESKAMKRAVDTGASHAKHL